MELTLTEHNPSSIIYGDDLPIISRIFTQYDYSHNYIDGKLFTKQKFINQKTSSFSPGKKISLNADVLNETDPYILLAKRAQDKLLHAFMYDAETNTYGRTAIYKPIATHVFREPFKGALTQTSHVNEPIFEGFTKPALTYGSIASTRIGALRNNFGIEYPHTKWKKFHKLKPFTLAQRMEIAFHIATNVWTLIDELELAEKILTPRWKNRSDYGNIAGYIATDQSSTDFTYRLKSDLIAIPTESYFDLLEDIEKIFQAMGKTFSPASSKLKYLEGQ